LTSDLGLFGWSETHTCLLENGLWGTVHVYLLLWVDCLSLGKENFYLEQVIHFSDSYELAIFSESKTV